MNLSSEATLTMVTPIGQLLLRTRHRRLTGVEILDEVSVAEASGAEIVNAADPVLLETARQITAYFAGKRREFVLPLDLEALPPFTRQILELLARVPFGTTLTYAELARRAGKPRAARAVGRVMAVNPLPLVIPCHRVVAAGGRLGGYSAGGGLRTKEWLLAFERAS